MPNSIIFLFAGIVGVAIGIVIMLIAGKMGLDRSREKSQDILDEANSKAETTIRQANLDGKQQVYEMKLQAEKEIKSQRDKIQQTENKLVRREDSLNFREENLVQKEKKVSEKEKLADSKLANLSKMEEELRQKINDEITVLERVSNMTQEGQVQSQPSGSSSALAPHHTTISMGDARALLIS